MLITSLFLPFSCSTKEKEVFQNLIITKVHDGDTFFDSKNNSYRLFGVDTPEISNQYNNFKKTENMEFIYALKAKNYAQNLLLNKKVKIKKMKKDKYKRTIAQIMVNNEDLAYLLVKEGLARVAYISINKGSPFYTTSFKYYKDLLNYQYLAYQNKKGFWSQKTHFKKIFPKS